MTVPREAIAAIVGCSCLGDPGHLACPVHPAHRPAPKIAARCTDCEGEFTEEQIAGASSCPGCGSVCIPCDPANDVQVTINWHELRILGVWAENWALKHRDSDPRMCATIKTIARRLERQHPKRTPLTLTGEIAEIPGAELHVGGGLIVKTSKAGA